MALFKIYLKVNCHVCVKYLTCFYAFIQQKHVMFRTYRNFSTTVSKKFKVASNLWRLNCNDLGISVSPAKINRIRLDRLYFHNSQEFIPNRRHDIHYRISWR